MDHGHQHRRRRWHVLQDRGHFTCVGRREDGAKPLLSSPSQGLLFLTGRGIPGTALLRVLPILFVAAWLQSCTVLPRLDAVPKSETEQAVVPGIPDSRLWLDRDLGPFIQMV